MRKTFLSFVLLVASTPAYAQTTSGATSAVNISNPASTDSKNRLITPPTIVAPGLAAAGMETCLGSATGGVSLMGLGLTFGRTTPDEGCGIRLAARQLFAFGYPKAALALMCQDTRVAEAMATAGQPCPVPSAEIGARRRQKFAELKKSDDEIITGSIDQPRGGALAFAKAKTVSVWKSPDAAAWKNPDGTPAQQSVEDAAEKTISPDEERWFARASPTY